MIVRLLVTLVTGMIGSYIFYKLKVKAGCVVGAILSVDILQIFTGLAYFPPMIKVAVQMVAGAFVGRTITRDDLREVKGLLIPSLLIFSGVLVLSLVSGFSVYFVSGLDIATSLLSTVPGGMTEISLMASDVGADPANTTVLQLMRYLLAIVVLPQINAKICAKYDKSSASSVQTPSSSRKSSSAPSLLWTLLITVIAGTIGKLSRFPAGAMVFPMFAVAAYNIKTGHAYLPPKLKLIAQSFAGVNVGVSITLSQVLAFRFLALPAVFVLLNCLLVNYLLGFLLYKISRLNLATCLFATVPAGMSDIVLISMEQGGDAPKVSVLQLVRYICVIVIMPSLIKAISSLF